jgi:hypothetical protein
MNEAGAPGTPEGSGAGSLDYPTNRVLGAVELEALREVIPALIAAGFAPIGILAGEAGLRRLRQTGGGSGIGGLLRRFQMSMGGDLDYVAQAEQQLQDGHALVDVEAEGDDAKDRARDVYLQHGGHFITYFGPWTIETLA